MVGWLVPTLHSLIYHYGDGSYFRGEVDSMGRPREGELYNKDQQLRCAAGPIQSFLVLHEMC